MRTRVLIVDDDANTVAVLGEMLAACGYDAAGVTDSRQAVGEARVFRPDVIVCDVNMPGLDGYEVLRSLKRDPRTAVIPFIFLSGIQGHENVRKGMRLGADDYLAKPIEREELIDSIEARISRQRQITEKLERLQRSLTGSVPHEFFTPLNVILGFSIVTLDQLRAGEPVDPADLQDSMESIKAAGEQLHHIASNYVLFTELSAEDGRGGASAGADASQPSLGPTVRRIATGHDRIPDLHYSFEPAILAARERDVEKIVAELLDNALKFSERGEWVSVTGAVHGADYVICVVDRGPGMDPAQIAALAPLVQFDRQTHARSGVGLGLAIARMLAARCGGSIEIARNAERGLRVSVRLPLAKLAAAG